MRHGTTAYIAGPMRGYDCYNFPQFFYWQVKLENSGYRVINPAREDCRRWLEEGWVYTDDQWEDVLSKDLEMIEQHADWMFVLRGWEQSAGAKREIEHAKKLDIPVFYEEYER